MLPHANFPHIAQHLICCLSNYPILATPLHKHHNLVSSSLLSASPLWHVLLATLMLVVSFINLLTRIKSEFCVRGSTAVCEKGGVGEEEGEGRGRRKGRGGKREVEEEEGGKARREGWESGERWEEGGEEKEGLSLISYQCGGMQTVQLHRHRSRSGWSGFALFWWFNEIHYRYIFKIVRTPITVHGPGHFKSPSYTPE